MVVPPSSPAKTVAEFIALAKSKPGKLNYGSGGVASLANLSAQAFRLAADIDYVHVPYKGAPDIVRGLLGNQVDVGFPTMPTAMRLGQQSALRALAVTSGSVRRPCQTCRPSSRRCPMVLARMPGLRLQPLPARLPPSCIGSMPPCGTPPTI